MGVLSMKRLRISVATCTLSSNVLPSAFSFCIINFVTVLRSQSLLWLQNLQSQCESLEELILFEVNTK